MSIYPFPLFLSASRARLTAAFTELLPVLFAHLETLSITLFLDTPFPLPLSRSADRAERVSNTGNFPFRLPYFFRAVEVTFPFFVLFAIRRHSYQRFFCLPHRYAKVK